MTVLEMYLEILTNFFEILYPPLHSVDLYRQAKSLAWQFGNSYSMLSSTHIEWDNTRNITWTALEFLKMANQPKDCPVVNIVCMVLLVSFLFF